MLCQQDNPHFREKRYYFTRNNPWISLIFSQTTPFLIRTFVKIGSFHRLTLFEDGALPTTDEQQIFTWYVMIRSFIIYH